MHADTQNNILCIALEGKQLELERARMQLEDQPSHVVKLKEQDREKTAQLTEEVSFNKSQLYRRRGVLP